MHIWSRSKSLLVSNQFECHAAVESISRLWIWCDQMNFENCTLLLIVIEQWKRLKLIENEKVNGIDSFSRFRLKKYINKIQFQTTKFLWSRTFLLDTMGKSFSISHLYIFTRNKQINTKSTKNYAEKHILEQTQTHIERQRNWKFWREKQKYAMNLAQNAKLCEHRHKQRRPQPYKYSFLWNSI